MSNNDKEFLKTLRKIVDENLNNDQFGATQLANGVNFSRSDLHNRLKRLTQQSVTQFIREIRLHHAYEKLKNNEATVAEIAYKVGFKSPSYFNYCFRDYYGFPPGEIKKSNINIDLLKDRNKRVTKQKESSRLNHFRKIHFSIILVVIATIIVSLFLLLNRSTEHKSVALFPFGNITQLQANDYFSQGLNADIKNHLCRIQNLTTISVCEYFLPQFNDQIIWETGKKLGVEYIIRGNLISLEEDEIEFHLQIIDINKKCDVFNDLFRRKTNNMYLFQNDIIRNILLTVKPSLYADELLYIHKSLTRIPQAYQDYLKGCYYLNSKSTESYNRALKHLNMALDYDPNYSVVYERIAEYYYQMGTIDKQRSNAHYFQAKIYAQKALKLDPNLSSAHAILGGVSLWSNWDLETAKEHLTKAIKINRNCCNAQNLYAQYLVHSGNSKAALKVVKDLLKQNPGAGQLHLTSCYIYLNLKEYNNVLKSSRIMQINHNTMSEYHWIELLALYHLGKYDMVALKAEEILKLNPATIAQANMVQHNYKRSGINGVFELLANAQHSSSNITPYEMAQLYVILKDYKQSLFWLKKAYQSHTPELITIKSNNLFNDLLDLKEYQQLLDMIYSK